MILSDQSIMLAIEQGQIEVEGLRPEAVQPASIDLHLAFPLRRLEGGPHNGLVDPEWPDLNTWHEWPEEKGPVIIRPGELWLGATEERLGLNGGHAARIDGLSSLGRLGLFIHASCTWADPGFTGNLTLELSTVAHPIILRPGMRICQVEIHLLVPGARRPYGHPERNNRYAGQVGATPGRPEVR